MEPERKYAEVEKEMAPLLATLAVANGNQSSERVESLLRRIRLEVGLCDLAQFSLVTVWLGVLSLVFSALGVPGTNPPERNAS
ncbi:MAG: hypothetical protein KatS3mg076_3210 [Candidatus Binatia bacterium]|nr:MAG: hypothetical protein KatS3mg076_3210 [Candidatus Binatia bacterium]